MSLLLKELSSHFISEKCFNLLLIERNIDEYCIKDTISKILSIGILAGSVLFKLPQILSILSVKKVDGISPFSFYCEFPMVMILIAYNYQQGNPFLTYGENIFVFIQNLILIILLWTYMKPKPSTGHILLISGVFGLVGALSFNIPPHLRYILPLTTPPLVVISRFSQVYVNYQNKSTGTLSPITTLLALAGAVARFFTTVQQVGWDWGLLSGIIATLSITSILALQFVLYSGNKVKSGSNSKKSTSTNTTTNTTTTKKKESKKVK